MYAGTLAANEVMNWDDLNHYQLDCNKKAEQIQFLNSMRTTESERIMIRAKLRLQPWLPITDGDLYDKQLKQGQGRYEWLINQHLHTLASQCY